MDQTMLEKRKFCQKIFLMIRRFHVKTIRLLPSADSIHPFIKSLIKNLFYQDRYGRLAMRVERRDGISEASIDRGYR